MSAPRWSRIRALFEAVCDLPPAQRRAYLATACAGDGALRREVESLLESSEGPDRLEIPVVKSYPELFEDGAAALIGRRFGPYRLVVLIARGGMGAVFLAERADGECERKVAVKVIDRKLVSGDLLRRFRMERRTLAGLDHPNIARLLDGGVTPDGLPYLVMEYVDGRPIDRYCDEEGLDIAARVRLFRGVCAAVSHAHRNLIVHRDLKPANVLVTADGAPKLVDFGIARVLGGPGPDDAADPTATHRRRLTPQYASPEQLRGEPVTTAGDVYALGVILFELLTGRRPYRLHSEMPHELERAICEQDPQRPSAAVGRVEPDDAARCAANAPSVSAARRSRPDRLRRRLAGDLDAIVLMALRKEPHKRYAGVEQLSEDLRRHLAGLPVAARQGSMRYRAWKFLKRNRAAAAAALVVAASVLVALSAVAWQGRAAVVAQRRTEVEARKLAGVNAFLLNMLASADGAAAPGPHGALRLMLEEATRSLEAGALEGQPEVAASVRTTVGLAFLRLGLLGEARLHLETALELREPLGPRHPDVAEALNNLGLLARAEGDDETAERCYRRALAARRIADGPGSPAYAETLNNLGVLLRRTGRLEAAEAALREALGARRARLEALRRRGADRAEVRAARRDVATTQTNLAAALRRRGDLAAAEPLYREATEALREVAGPRHYRVAVCLNNLALLLRQRGAYGEAEPLLREALSIRREVFGEEHRAVSTGLKNLALLLTDMERYEEAEPLYRRALRLDRRLPGDVRRLGNTLTLLADLLAKLGRHDEAEPLAVEAVAIRRAEGASPSRLAGSLMVLGSIRAGRGDAGGAEPLLREALSLYRDEFPEDDGRLARARSELGGCLTALGRFAEAERLLAGAWSVLEEGRVHRPLLARRTRNRIAALYEAWGRPEEAGAYRTGTSSKQTEQRQ